MPSADHYLGVLWAIGAATASKGISLENLDPAHLQLMDYSKSFGRGTIVLSEMPCGGRCLPWPTTVKTEKSLYTLSTEDYRARNEPYETLPHLTKEADEGEEVTVSSGVGKWARPIEASWSWNKHLWWQHEPDQPDWTDYRAEGRFKIDHQYDLILSKATLRDRGRYTSRFRLQPKGIVYVMETNLTIYQHPQPIITSPALAPGARRLSMPASATTTELLCRMVRSHPKVTLSWERNLQQVQEDELTREDTVDSTTLKLNITRADNGSLITCCATNIDTRGRKTTSIIIKTETPPNGTLETSGAENQGLDDQKTPFRASRMKSQLPDNQTTDNPTAAELEEKQDRGILGTTTEKIAIYLMAAVALTAATIGATLMAVARCNSRPRKANYHLTRTINQQ